MFSLVYPSEPAPLAAPGLSPRDEILPTLAGTDSAVRGCRKLEGEEDGDR